MPSHQNNFSILVEIRFYHVGQAGLKLLTTGDLPISASQSAGITGISHCAWPRSILFNFHMFVLFLKFLLLLITSFIPLWSEKMLDIISIIYLFVYLFIETESHSAAQVGVQ